MHTPTFYWSPGACSLAVHLALAEAGVAFESVKLVLAEGAHREPAYLAVNPAARVPALAVNGQVLTEAPAILLYLESAYPAAGPLPAGGVERARVVATMNFIASTLHIGFAALWRPERFTDDAAARQALQRDAKGRIEAALDLLEARLPAIGGASGWLGGDRFSVADAYLLPFWRWTWRIGAEPSRWPRFDTLARRVAARPAAQRVAAIEGIALFPETTP